MESWISPKTVVAPIKRVMIPITAAMPPLPVTEAFFMISWTWAAASFPIKPCAWL
jgi:hypothetical protein